MERRKFLKNSSLAAAGGLTIVNFPLFGKNAPSNKVIIAVMGVNSRGAFHIKNFSKIPGVEVAYICDVEDGAIKRGFDAVPEGSRKPVLEKDIRKLVAKTDFDALVIGAPDHWHAPAALIGVSNGKHVYVEKPAGHNPRESEILVQASEKYNKLIQVGSQRRSFPNLIEAKKLISEGIIGNPYMGKSWYVNARKPIGVGKVVPVPSTLGICGRGLLRAKTTRTTWCIIIGTGYGIGEPQKPATTETTNWIACAGSWMLIMPPK